MSPHGTRARRLKGCTCEPCLKAAAAYCKEYRLRRIARPESTGVPAAPVAAHVAELRRTMTYEAIGGASGVSSSVLRRLKNQRKVNAATARAVMRVQPAKSTGKHYVSALGSTRRLRALMANGWGVVALANATGLTRQNVTIIVQGDRDSVWSETADRIRDVYAELSMKFPPKPVTRTEKSHRARIANTVRRNGWAPPLAWGDDMDNPDATPEGVGFKAGPVIDTIRELQDMGLTRDAIAARLGVRRDTVDTHIQRATRKADAA